MRKLIEAQAQPALFKPGVGHSVAHESACKHVSGSAQYIDDLPLLPGLVHVATGQSIHPHARIILLDIRAVRAAPGVVDVIVQRDIPGEVDVGPVYGGDPLLAGDLVEYIGQPLFAVAATSLEAAQRAVKLARVEYDILPAQLTVEDALAARSFVLPEHQLLMGDPDSEIDKAPHRLQGEIYVRGQEHFYLEGQISQAQLTEDGGIHVISSSQHPSEIQKLVAEVLDLPLHLVVAEVRRMGGGFGGKESQAAPLACMAAIFAKRLQRPVRYRMPRRDDMVQTGKRHDFLNRWRVGFDSDGHILGVDMLLAGKCGYSPDLSEGIVDRAMFHADNAYFLRSARILGVRCKTHTVSNTAFRGFGGPKGMMAIESLIEDIARHLGKDPLDVRKLNLYRPGADETPYGQKIEQHVLQDLIARLELDSDYRVRREQVTRFNQTHRYLKKGLALTPVKFGISFTAKHLNQAGALLQIYTDGSLMINQGGTEMGQGLYTKIQQIVASAFGVSVERVIVSATRTDKVPNTSPTAASSGTDLNGMAAKDACDRIKADLIGFACEHFQLSTEQIVFANNRVQLGRESMSFPDFIKLAYLNRIPLLATGYYRTPKIFYNRDTAKGQPFLYFANGAAVSEVTLDTRTGEYQVNRTDILHDVGKSLNPAIDIGQIEGGFVQGMGWLTSEELLWDDKGRIISNSPANYKIPTAFDVPADLRVALYHEPNLENTIHLSKAVGEPPLMLGIAVWAALRDACSSTSGYRFSPRLDTPATPERVYWALQECAAFNACQAQEVDRA
ncbi:xanthine dehydrogenase molybdopterin binding subunit [Cellvibrio japonicus]|uniref:Xanthine dehydrogenase n=1 Tax=Cellvibrio japonicus (strain Ueda107) TaxID=498211 RepID=B3PJ36_CELJU|nr:xanthine dehydrogenase molybdopterin binding subunit [Cellvibrio japonicus]ACE84052.1 xanthine dehydrogenase [Cellvibrio japonicus Ueda107]QEI11236.1 xanthine dehydrogenase molybdopterin binding subunit [Cellvibrio japonicus]QEI14810.1 xanthine dehydrogenase molybdopterin binding subunit [Cellvibrio japonicus]QEI18390.1 xanthine dehydrogenase molybdopterin binding subunit [Cellvibrio japonicus]